MNVQRCIVLGDIFNSRKSQELSVLIAFKDILDMFYINGIELIAIDGNHDKVSGVSNESYLDPFTNFEFFDLRKEHTHTRTISDIEFHFVPFYEEQLFLQKFKEIKIQKDKKNVLCIHQGINGAVNNDRTLVQSDIKKSLFKGFDKVFSGHYHDRNGIYIGSICQNNYGEDDQKGFTILYDDLTTDFRQSKFKEFIKVNINLNENSQQQIDDIIYQFDANDLNVRFEFTGDQDKIDSIDTDKYKSLGFDVKKKNKDIENSLDIANNDEVVEFNDSQIIEEFNKFCQANNIVNNEIGLNYLKDKLNVDTRKYK